VSLLDGMLLAAAVAGVALSLRAPGVRVLLSVAPFRFYGLRTPQFLVCAATCLRPYTRQVAPHSSSPPAPWAPVLSFLKRVNIISWMLKFLSGL
jgi:hypothetical protein